MKMKRKPERVLERITRFVKWVCWDEFLEMLRSWLIAVGVVTIIMVFLIFMFAIRTVPLLPHERYQVVFDDCIAAAALTAKQCHDIALAVVQ